MEQVHKTEKKSWSCWKCGKVYAQEKKPMEHQTTCGEIHKKKKDPTRKKQKDKLIPMEDMVTFSIFKQYFSENCNGEPVCISLCVKCVSICLT